MNLNLNPNMKVNLNFNLNLKLNKNLNWGSAQYSTSEKFFIVMAKKKWENKLSSTGDQP